MSDFKAEKSEVPELSWASDRLRKDIAPHGGVKERIRDAAVALGWKYSRARTIWYADERASVKPKELRRITEVTGIEYGHEELRSVEQLIANADALGRCVMPGRIVFLDWITRDMVRAEPDARFVFGDNVEREGFGGQAAAMRGEPNAIGVATKWSTGGAEHDYYASGDALAPAASESAAILNVIERTGLIRPADLRAGSTENVLTHQPA